ncbi:MAG: hypothetical protein ABJN69_06315 [Hellea sp.]
MNDAPHKILKACYFPAFRQAAEMPEYKKQAEWHLAPLGDAITVEFPQTQTQAETLAQSADIVFFWQKEAFWTAKAAYRRKGIIVDEYAQQAVGDGLDAFVAQYISPDYAGHSDSFFKAVKARRPDIKQAILIGSGRDMSSLAGLSEPERESSLSLYLSTSVLNEQACEACPPDIIIAVDGPSQFGLSETGRRYRERAAQLVRRYKSLILVPAQHLPSIRAHWPEDIQDHVFAVPLARKVKPGHRFDQGWRYEPTSNVSTSFGLPCAASFTNTIKFAGVSAALDRQEINPHTHHWEHVDESLYQRHVAPMLAAHPASGQDNAGYLARHHARLDQELSAYAASGVVFSKLGGSPLEINAKAPPQEAPETLPLKVRIFETIAKAEHYPGRIIACVFILAGLLGTALQYSMGLDMLGFLITGGVAAVLVAGILFLRLRMNRMTARLESKLSQQQAQQFANLSERLEALERKK